MKYLQITNTGVLDMRLVALMGGTTKSKNEFKIGTFGTGLKYTLAYLFRNNLSFRIFCGTEECKVTTVKETIQDIDFEIIYINGERTSITTEMGRDWTAWMIIRELWCNALDEGGSFKKTTEETIGTEGCTSFFIQISDDIKRVILNWQNYFVHEQVPIFESDIYRIYPGGNKLRLYKQGVLIHEEETPALFSYDIRNASINELRQFMGYTEREIYLALKDANEPAIRYFLDNCKEEHYEGGMNYDFSWLGSFSETWKTTIGNATLIHKKAVEAIKERELDIDLVASVVVPKTVYDVLTTQFKGVGALRMASKNNEFYQTVDQELEGMIKQGLTLLETCDYFISPELSFVYGVFGDKRTLAKVSMDEKVIYISESMKNSSLFQIVAMLIEENEHFNTGFHDNSRQFQQHFINLFTKTLLNKNAITL